MPSSHTESEAYRVAQFLSVDKFASELLDIIEQGIKNKGLSEEGKVLLNISKSIIALHQVAYHEVKKELMAIGSKT